MSVRITTLPEITRPGVGVVKVGTWLVDKPERQRATVSAISEVGPSQEWPDPRLLSWSLMVGEDGRSLLHYSQWRDEAGYQDFFRTGRDAYEAEIDAAVPEIERAGPGSYELYRSETAAEGDTREPGCVVIVDIEFEGPDRGRQREWTDTVVAALANDVHMGPAAIAAHFHVSTDGTRVLNYAEWENAEGHIAALNSPGEGIGSSTELWERVRNFPGRVSSTVNRYTPAISLSPGPVDRL
ncbi:antibiotic biosynthesis monooxygenase [Streptomyces camponoticapitis]|uniref:Antibiotic biosynthesis monooxygenase n=1 Tax=Streptomyces camponoticapitis TaxID=1616125 RepID=A0ABQ2E9W3_9ACTN|nr:antibiotic biosynthesis monooxygenase [Streptomyces camponoticapitis]GGK02664.1 antibiotic biosynthesis monooxygenase [Streptomyces camponoticapitis]